MSSNWMTSAACRGRDADMWFSDDPMVTETAAEICRSCPVRRPCLSQALDGDGAKPHGVWGGLTGDQRRVLRGDDAPKRPGISGQERRNMRARSASLTREGLSAREVAIRLGVDQRTVERWIAEARATA